MTLRVYTLALLLVPVFASSARTEQFQQCVADNTEFYGTYCFTPNDVAAATISSCRAKAQSISFMNDPVLTDGDKRDLLEKYIATVREDIVRRVLDHRIRNKIDCGQYNSLATPNDIDAVDP